MSEYDEMVPIHEIVLDLYKEFKKVCDDNGLRYFAISGTTLGAVLWNGFIPWDDDMDIALPVEDYDKFLELYRGGAFPDYIGINEYDWFGSKFYNRETMYTGVYYLNNPDRLNGVFIDVVPLINVPNNELERRDFVTSLKKVHRNGVLLDLYGVLDDLKTKKVFHDLRKKVLYSYRFGDTKFVMDFSDYRYVLDAAGFESPIDFRFEDTTIPVSSGYKKDLRTQYGDYKKYPPKEKRISMHQLSNIVDLETPCEIYADELRSLSDRMKKIVSVQHQYLKNRDKEFFTKEEYVSDLVESNNRLLKEHEKVCGELRKIKENTLYKIGTRFGIFEK